MKNILKYLYYKIKGTLYPDLYIDDEFLLYVLKKREGLIRNFSEIETLALGSSMADYSFYTPYWDKAYNLGLTSADLFLTYSLYSKFRYSLKTLKNIIVFLGVFDPGFSLIRTVERYRVIVYDCIFDLNIDYDLKDLFIKKIINRCNEFSLEKDVFFHNNFYGYEKKTMFGFGNAKKRACVHLRENKREPSQLYWLLKLNMLVVQDNKKMTIVIPPFRSDYKSYLPSSHFLFKKLYELDLKNIEIISYYDNKLFSNEDFGDTDHLNEKGAIKLTKDLMQKISIVN